MSALEAATLGCSCHALRRILTSLPGSTRADTYQPCVAGDGRTALSFSRRPTPRVIGSHGRFQRAVLYEVRSTPWSPEWSCHCQLRRPRRPCLPRRHERSVCHHQREAIQFMARINGGRSCLGCSSSSLRSVTGPGGDSSRTIILTSLGWPSGRCGPASARCELTARSHRIFSGPFIAAVSIRRKVLGQGGYSDQRPWPDDAHLPQHGLRQRPASFAAHDVLTHRSKAGARTGRHVGPSD